MALPSPSSITARLIDLLRWWQRRHIHQAISCFDDPSIALQSGAVARWLERVPRRRQPWPADYGPQVVGLFDPDFPALLAQIPDPPLVLGYLGSLAALAPPTLAMIGARRCSAPGRRWAEQIGIALSSAGVRIVSGLALGIDGASHEGALAANAPTAAVLGSGLREIYPARHRNLARRIVDSGGVLVSEYPAGFSPRRSQFPERNRLISGLCLAVVVVEAGERSGSLITARLALEQGRDVMAVPGPVTSWTSAGCHRLIQQGAALVCDERDVLAAMGLDVGAPAAMAGKTLQAGHAQILNTMSHGPAGIDEIAAMLGLPHADVVQALVILELGGFVEQSPLGYIRTS